MIQLSKQQAIALVVIKCIKKRFRFAQKHDVLNVMHLTQVWQGFSYDEREMLNDGVLASLVKERLIFITEDMSHGMMWKDCILFTNKGLNITDRIMIPVAIKEYYAPLVIPRIEYRSTRKVKTRGEIALGRRFGVTPDGIRTFID